MVCEPVEQGSGHLGIAEYGRPLVEGQVRRDDDRGPLVKPADQMEEKLAAGLREGEIAKLVHHDEVEPGDEVGEPALFSIACFRLKPIDEIDDVVEAPTQFIRGTHGRSQAERSCFGCNFQGDRELTDGSTEVFQEVHLFNRVVVLGSESNPMISRELGKAVDDIDRVGGTQWPTLANGRIQARKPPLDDIDRETETHLAF